MISEWKVVESSFAMASSDTLCSHLARGLHAAAQPLTVLLASLGAANTDRMNAAELRELTASSAVEVQRVCTLFRCLQQLVIVESIKPQLSATPILPLLAHVADGVNRMFEKDGMCLSSMVPTTCEPVLIDRMRTEQALSSVLLAAHAFGRKQDTIDLIASSTANTVQIVVRNVNLSMDAMSTEESLSMALAEANIRSQQGSFSVNMRPFTVQVELQKMSRAQE
jgi:signal transduction histidine kinase